MHFCELLQGGNCVKLYLMGNSLFNLTDTSLLLLYGNCIILGGIMFSLFL